MAVLILMPMLVSDLWNKELCDNLTPRGQKKYRSRELKWNKMAGLDKASTDLLTTNDKYNNLK